MKRALCIVLTAMILSLGTYGCQDPSSRQDLAQAQEVETPEVGVVGRWYLRSDRYGVTAFKDPDTGCEYLFFTSYKAGGFVPRTASDGKHQKGCPTS